MITKPSQAKPSQAKPSQAKPSQAKPSQAKPSSEGNRNLTKAKNEKQDEFYTQLVDISNELKHYKNHLRGKTVLCNCDDPFESNFFKYFALNFNTLGLKKLMAASYRKSSIVGTQLPLFAIEGLKPEGKEPYAIEINKVPARNGGEASDLTDVEYLLKQKANTARTLKGDATYGSGDFRSQECVEMLKQADIVVTNPPFSLFREFVAHITAHKKKFLIIGSINAITYKEIFKLIKENQLWLGESIHSGDREFRVPDHYPLNAVGCRIDDEGHKYIRVKGVRWFTNIEIKKSFRHEFIPLYKKYSSSEYPRYDNYAAIEVGKVSEIPVDYSGHMGVPITFLDKHNPEQFEILGMTSGRNEFQAVPIKRYKNPLQHNTDGTISNGSKANTRATILLPKRPSEIYYTAENANGPLQIVYARIIIQRKG